MLIEEEAESIGVKSKKQENKMTPLGMSPISVGPMNLKTWIPFEKQIKIG
jgi:hypothetical protein